MPIINLQDSDIALGIVIWVLHGERQLDRAAHQIGGLEQPAEALEGRVRSALESFVLDVEVLGA